MTKAREPRCSVIGMLRTRAISRSSMKSTAMDAVLDYPQSGERIRGRHNIQESRFVQPNKKRFTVRRIVGSGELWVTEVVLSYDGIPSYAVSIMEFRRRTGGPRNPIFRRPVRPWRPRARILSSVVEQPASTPRCQSDASW